jgi:hypothetical protein
VNHHELLDLTGVQEDTADISIVFKAHKGQSIDLSQPWVLDYTRNHLSGFRKKGIEYLVMGVAKSRYMISRRLQV